MSDTPRTDNLMGNVLGRRVALDPEYRREQQIIDHARQLEAELSAALQREKTVSEKYNACMRRLEPTVEYVDGQPVGYGEDEIDRLLQRAEKAEAAQNPCTCVPDGDDGTVAHLCQWHKKQFGKAYRMQNIADTLTVENVLKLPSDSLRRFIAHGIQESTARKKAEAELSKWERFKTDDATLTKLKAQSKDSGSLAAQGIYIAALETALTRYREAEKALPEEPTGIIKAISDGACKTGCGSMTQCICAYAEDVVDYAGKLRAHAAALQAERDALREYWFVDADPAETEYAAQFDAARKETP